MSSLTHGIILIVSLSCLLLQLITGTPMAIALLLTSGIVSGLYAIPVGGGFRSLPGLLNAVLVTQFLIIATLLKFSILEPMDENLLAPVATSTVMAIGFLGLLIGTWLHRRTPAPSSPLIPEVRGSAIFLALTILCLVFGYGGYFIGMSPYLDGDDEIKTGGILGVARIFGGFGSFTIVPVLFFLWARGSTRFMSHPLALSVLLLSSTVGIFSTSKQGAMEPLFFFLAVCVLRYGPWDKRVWSLVLLGVFVYAWIIFPYSQYVRFNGGREGSLSSRAQVSVEVLWRTMTDPTFRTLEERTIDQMKSGYLDRPHLQAFSRFAMIGEADRLIAATKNQNVFTGWETITWALKMLTPRFMFPDKPAFSTGNYLGHIAGDAPPDDLTTQWAYGVMANLYNAFAYWGVFWGSILLFLVFYQLFRIIFGDLVVSSTPSGSSIWFLLIVAKFHHSVVESSVAALIEDFVLTLGVVLFLYHAAKYISAFLPDSPASDAGSDSQLLASSRFAVPSL